MELGKTTRTEPSILNWVNRNRETPRKWGQNIYDWFVADRKATYGLAVMRIASGTLILGWLVFNLPVAAKIWGPGSAYWQPYRDILGYQWPFTLLNNAGTGVFWLWYVIAIVLAVVFLLGWRTRFITPLFFIFYTTINAQNTPISDGGNYFIRIMLIYLIFADLSNVWSLDSLRRRKTERVPRQSEIGTVFHNVALCLVVAQLCLVYFEAGMYKVQGSLWQSGAAMYYPISSEYYGVFPWLSQLITHFSWSVVLITYITVIAQIAFPFMLFNRITRRIALVIILGMHIGIAIVMGLPFFSGIMASADAVLVSGTTWILIQRWGVARWDDLKAKLGLGAKNLEDEHDAQAMGSSEGTVSQSS